MWECSSIQEINYTRAKEFIGRQKDLILKPTYNFFALLENGEIKSVLGISENLSIKIHCNYTKPQDRGKGYFSRLLQEVIKQYEGKLITADCLEASKNIYIKSGFELIASKQYKNFIIYKVKKV